MSGDTYRNLTPVECRKPEAQLSDKLIEDGGTVEYEKNYARKNGSRVPVRLKMFVVDYSKQDIGIGAVIKVRKPAPGTLVDEPGEAKGAEGESGARI